MTGASTAPSAGSEEVSYLIAIYTLEAVGGIGLLVVLLTVLLSRTVHRQSTWTNFCVAWIVSSISYLLLPLSGQSNAQNPHQILCVSQSALIYGAPIVAAYTAMSLILHLFMNVYNSLYDDGGNRNGLTIQTFWLLISPWMMYALIIVVALVQGSLNIDTVQRDLSYCHISTGTLGRISDILIMFAIVVIICLEIAIGIVLHRRWRLYRSLKMTKAPSLDMLIRIMAFTLLAIVAFCLAGVLIYNGNIAPAMDQVMIGFMHSAVFLTLGIQRDIVCAWIWWKKRPTGSEGCIVEQEPRCSA